MVLSNMIEVSEIEFSEQIKKILLSDRFAGILTSKNKLHLIEIEP